MRPTTWVRFEHAGREGFGRLDGDRIRVHHGNLFDAPQDSGVELPADAVRLLAPTRPSKVLALWNNVGQLAAKLGLARPAEPLYLIKPPNTYLDPGAPIRRPSGDGKLVFEGELAIVIGRRATRVALGDAMGHVLGFTCANDVTIADLIHRDPSFPQWVRAKGFDTFCPFGPAARQPRQRRNRRNRHAHQPGRVTGAAESFPLSMRFAV
jgi:2-keto-4-pentenoate hydratase/2-oxohepta-3-ene-1,7-dioic acid hydratase in catechol pathway